jgi:hypothetical protein
MSLFWRIYCLTEQKWVYTSLDVTPTVCPNVAEHTVNAQSVQSLGREASGLRISNLLNSITSGVLVPVFTFSYNTLTRGPIHRIRINAFGTNGTTQFDVQLYNLTTDESMGTKTFTNTSSLALVNMTFDDIIQPQGDVLLQLRFKRNNGLDGTVECREVVVYSDVDNTLVDKLSEINI